MNLIDHPWIPVTYGAKDVVLVSLKELYLKADQIRDLSANPPQRIALMRLLLCITQAALDGPSNDEEWKSCLPRILPESLAYLDKWHNSFELYGENAFLQPEGLIKTDNATLDKLDFGLSSGNNDRLFDHAAIPEGRQWPNHWCALMMLTYQNFSPGGLIGTTEWNGVTTSSKSNHSPCIASSMLHSIVIGNSLLQTIHLNLLTKKQISTNPNMEWGNPVWEDLPSSSENNSVYSFLGRLVPLSRNIHLSKESNKITLADGLKYPILDTIREPMATVRLNKQNKNIYVSVSLDRHPWRELGSILELPHNDSNSCGAFALKKLRKIEEKEVDLWTGGLVADKAKLIDTAEWLFSINTDMIGDIPLNNYKDGVKLAQDAETSIYYATKEYSSALSSDNTYSSVTKTLFWSILDTKYEILLNASQNKNSEAMEEWFLIVREAMTIAYDRICARITPRQIEAYAKGKNKLFLKNPYKDHNIKQKEEH